MSQLPPLSAIRAFEAAARHRNYTRAGEELGLTQAAVSYQIKNLEQRVGTVLFVRNGRTMELTPAGEVLAPQISDAFASMERAFAKLGDSEGSVLSIACFQTFAVKILAPKLGAFQIAHPEIAVRLDVTDRFVELEAGEWDIAVRLSVDIAPDLVSHDLMPLKIAPFASPDYLALHPDLQSADPEIAEEHRISRSNAWWQAWDAARCPDASQTEAEVGPRGLVFDSQVLDAEAAMSGNGVAILATSLFRVETSQGRLQQVGSQGVRPGGVFRLAYPEVRRHSPKVRVFRAWLMQEFAELFDRAG